MCILHISKMFTTKDLRLLKSIHITLPEEPELAVHADIQALMGQDYWDLMERTAARVAKWPAWKTGTTKTHKRTLPSE